MIRRRIVTKIIDACGERKENGPDTKASLSNIAADRALRSGRMKVLKGSGGWMEVRELRAWKTATGFERRTCPGSVKNAVEDGSSRPNGLEEKSGVASKR